MLAQSPEPASSETQGQLVGVVESLKTGEEEDFSSLEFFSPVFRLFPAPNNCPWVSEDAEPEAHDKVLDNSRSNWNLEMLVLRRVEYPEKNLSEHKLNPHMTPGPGIEPGTHWWETSAHTTAPSLLPICSYNLQPAFYPWSAVSFYP